MGRQTHQYDFLICTAFAFLYVFSIFILNVIAFGLCSLLLQCHILRQLIQLIMPFSSNLTTISTEQPTYWPSDSQKTSDLLNFLYLYNQRHSKEQHETPNQLGLKFPQFTSPLNNTQHGPSAQVSNRNPFLTNKVTVWNNFRNIFDRYLNCNCNLLKIVNNNNSAVYLFTKSFYNALLILMHSYNCICNGY